MVTVQTQYSYYLLLFGHSGLTQSLLSLYLSHAVSLRIHDYIFQRYDRPVTYALLAHHQNRRLMGQHLYWPLSMVHQSSHHTLNATNINTTIIPSVTGLRDLELSYLEFWAMDNFFSLLASLLLTLKKLTVGGIIFYKSCWHSTLPLVVALI